MQVLEALLRLRQAACHPGLLDPKRVGEPSAKFDRLLEQLAELREEGHKALVFSQFTSLLAILRRNLDEAGKDPLRIPRRRDAPIARPASTAFQNDPACATVPHQPEGRRPGPEPDRRGVRLPARSRGGTRRWKRRPWTARTASGRREPVFAYRLIARDTVEEKGASSCRRPSGRWPTPSWVRTTA
jgi:hypothetical protein